MLCVIVEKSMFGKNSICAMDGLSVSALSISSSFLTSSIIVIFLLALSSFVLPASSAPFPVYSYSSSSFHNKNNHNNKHDSNKPARSPMSVPLRRAPAAPPPSLQQKDIPEENSAPPADLYFPAPPRPQLTPAAATISRSSLSPAPPLNSDSLLHSIPLHSRPPLSSSSTAVEYGPWMISSVVATGGADSRNSDVGKVGRLEEVVLPARRVCEKGWIDSDLNACVFYDKTDKQLPHFTCPEGSVLDGNFCYGRIISDFEISCPKKFAANTDGLCIRAIVYSPSRLVCPEGFEVRSFTSARLKQCVKVMYVQPKHIPIENLLPALQPSSSSSHHHTNKHDDTTNNLSTGEGGSSCGGITDKFCPLPPRTYTADKQFLLECPEGRLVKVRNTKEAVCRVRMVVPPDTRDTCKKGYSWTIVEGAGGACMRLTAFTSLQVCPKPTPKFGPGLGDWETPDYHYDPVDRCVAYKAKASGGNCPDGYTLEEQMCLRKLVLPFYYDCNNVEGYGFRWNAKEQTGECVFEYDPFKWSAGVPYLTKRTEFDNARIQLFSNPYEAKVAYNNGLFAQRVRGAA
eukprot:GHVS01081262.1.p1 GENE.GHVS01081262.1~~GHVS01081262.1.p1  ORF type:complete len:571 (+),score=101.59 GHVS01081262.1:46-1758(+)